MQTQDAHSLQGAPASVQAIVQQLSGHAPMTGKEIREATGLPRRTVYTALRRLREMGLLQERSSLKDTRQTYFWLAGDAANWQPHPTS
jgi:DNA-binding MarR family transcriptional regulator